MLVGWASAATLIGQAGTSAYYLPDASTAYPSQTVTPAAFLVGAGEEQEITIEDVTTFNVDFDAADLAVLINTSLTDPAITNQPFSGLVFTSVGFLTLASATVDAATTLSGFDNSRVTLAGDQLRLNFAGLSYDDGNLVKLTFTSASDGAIPEPATWAMMILGFGAVGAMARNRRRATGGALA